MSQPRLPVVLTDIEGTTSSIDYVHGVMFPYARKHLLAFIEGNHWQPEVRAALDAVAAASALPPDELDALGEVLLAWIDEDRKVTPLKDLQGMIWKAGFASGELRAHIYPDAAAMLGQWHAAGHPIHVYSSGSKAAQKLYFGHTEAGDLTPLLSGYFDTTSGPKREADSYRRIAQAIGHPPQDIVFLSDIEAEIAAADAAGLRTVWITRDARPDHATRPAVTSFTAIDLGT